MHVAKDHADVLVDTWDGETCKIKVRIEFLLQEFTRVKLAAGGQPPSAAKCKK